MEELDYGRAAALLTAASDVTLVIAGNGRGTIRDITFGSAELAREIDQEWIGKSWPETVTPESRPKIEALLRDAASDAPPRWRQVNHPSTAGTDLPIVYTAMRVGTRGEVIAIGRNVRPIAVLQQRLLETQQLVEREYARLRQSETRHRLLFQVSAEAIVIAEAGARRIVEANPAAHELLGVAAGEWAGKDLLSCFDGAASGAIETLLATVRATGRMESLKVACRGSAAQLTLTVSLFREGASAYFLVRMSPLGALRESTPRRQSRVLEVVEGGPDGFVVTNDRSGRIVYANRAFLDMAQLPTESLATGESLDRWLGRQGVDFGLLTAHLREHGSIRQFATTLRGEHGSSTDVEISGVAVPDGEEPCLGFTIRDVSHRPRAADAVREAPRSVEQIAQLVGRVPLKDLVRESSDVIERMCIEAALELTRDNRASAAEILGLSRQGLYAKLRRYGLGDLERSPDEDEVAEG
ncbi:MAG: transcriptional regulator PpsR [Proteobacteria bacterium]|nr:transcriptional regulator PpsR [Pseudomonadota bacterium]